MCPQPALLGQWVFDRLKAVFADISMSFLVDSVIMFTSQVNAVGYFSTNMLRWFIALNKNMRGQQCNL